MNLRRNLAVTLAETFPGEAAAVLEHRDPDEVSGVLQTMMPEVAAGIIERMAPVIAARVIEQTDAENAANIFAKLRLDPVLSLLRRVTPECREAIVSALPRKHSDAVSSVLGFAPGTAGALMDPRVPAIPSDLTVEDSFKILRSDATYSHYNLYIIDRDHILVGVLNLQELLNAKPKAQLGNIMNAPLYRLEAGAGSHAVVDHPGWSHIHSLPVVDDKGRYLGAIRYGAFRRLEAEIRGYDVDSKGSTAQALGDLFATGLGGVITAIASSVSPGRRDRNSLNHHPGRQGE